MERGTMVVEEQRWRAEMVVARMRKESLRRIDWIQIGRRRGLVWTR